jgi:hypothetical protein
MISGESQLLIVNADQVQHFAVRLNGCPLLTDDANPRCIKKSRDGILCLCIDFMVAEAAENAEWRTEARERLYHRSLCCRIVGNIVAGQRHQVGFQAIGDGNATANLVRHVSRRR